MGLTLDTMLQARERIAPYVKPSPLMRSDEIQKHLGYKSPIYFKLESEQPTGSFKVRGAFNVILQLKPEIDTVVTYSSGNFAQAVAYAASKSGKKATIVMPEGAPKIKIEGTKKWGADIVFFKGAHSDSDAIVKELSETKGFYPLHPFNDYRTMAGQSTIAFEILDSNIPLKHFFCPVGGGGLLSGCAAALKAKHQGIRIFSVEPIGAHDFYESFRAKKHITFEKINTICDGLRANSVGTLNYPILMSTVDQVQAVPEDSVIEAMRLFWKHHNMVVEPSGATALAGFLNIYKELTGEVVIIVSGKNVDPESFKKWVG